MKHLRTAGIIAVIILLFGLVIFGSSTRQSPAEQVWNEAMTVGSLDSPNYYVMYTDLMCPYCDVFSREVMKHWDEFEAYLAEHKILFEIRLTDYLYEGNNIQYSRDSAEAAYCAMHESKFWDYYHAALQALWDDYHSKGIGDSKSSPMIKNLPEDYWKNIGHGVGLGEKFDQCVDNHETVAEIEENTLKASQVAAGMPYFKFNNFTNSGFDNSWDWEYVKLYLDSGLRK